jgi:hypothetical protein
MTWNATSCHRNAKRSTNPEVLMQREGTLHILRINRKAHDNAPSYHVGFADYQSGATKTRTFMGDEPLRSFLDLEMGLSSPAIESAFAGLKREGIANIFNVSLSDDKLARFGLL